MIATPTPPARPDENNHPGVEDALIEELKQPPAVEPPDNFNARESVTPVCKPEPIPEQDEARESEPRG